MKLIVATIQDEDVNPVSERLREQNIGLTRVGSTGGFLQQGNTTLLIGVEDSMVESAIDTLRKNCQRRKKFVPITANAGRTGEGFFNYVEVEVGGAIAFVIDVVHFEQF
jgi:uncharacterized protein YaaQ